MQDLNARGKYVIYKGVVDDIKEKNNFSTFHGGSTKKMARIPILSNHLMMILKS